MTFDELKLCMAIQRARLGGRDFTSKSQRLFVASSVMQEFVFFFEESRFPYSIDDIDKWRLAVRKNKDTRTKIEVAFAHGVKCFWLGRDKGPCSDEVECGHLLQASSGGPLSVANCVIECRAHNNQRRAMSIESYINSDIRTTAGADATYK